MERPEPLSEVLRRSLRSAGLPIARLNVDLHYELHHEPDRVEHDYFSAIGRETWHKHEFTAPLFQWQFDDGRRFQGRPTVALRKHSAHGLLWTEERWDFDQQTMLREVAVMVRRSMQSGADRA